ncbi:hypothetical protein IFR05_009795 [Cadophora sp. M221]|nr:hypothetical protein IFR05_009795 [Cadophora sp. M221]
MQCGIFDFRVAEEPVRRISMMNTATHHRSEGIKKYQVWVDGVDFDKRVLKCRPSVGSNGNETEKGSVHACANSEGDKNHTFDVHFDQLVIAPGSEVNRFNTPGVEQHCHFMKSVSDAMSVREKILDCFELASLPHFSTSQKRTLLHFVIIGGGPTGVELAAELDELIHGHLLSIYPECRDLVSVSVYDVANRMLGMFGEKLSEYAMEKFRMRNVGVCMGKHIEGFEEGKMSVKEDGEVGFGIAVWAAGNKTCGLVEGMEGVRKDEDGKVVTDGFLRVLRDEGEGVMDSVYALGDAASIDGNELAATAEVAVQKARWLAEYLIAGNYKNEKQQAIPQGKKFEYQQKALVGILDAKMALLMAAVSGQERVLGWLGGVATCSGRRVGDVGV